MIDDIHLEFPYYGFRPMTKALKRNGLKINKKPVQRIMNKYGLLSQIKKLFKLSTTNSQHQFRRYDNLIKDLNSDHPNSVWAADITYVRLGHGFCYVAVIIDLFSRKIKGWAISQKLDHYNLTLPALRMALNHYAAPQFHHSDQGVQYACDDYVNLLKERGIKISMSAKANPYENGICESFFKTLKYNEVYFNDYDNFEEACANISHFIEQIYNQKRLHSSLNYLPPDEFEQNYFLTEKDKNQCKLEISFKNDALQCPARPC